MRKDTIKWNLSKDKSPPKQGYFLAQILDNYSASHAVTVCKYYSGDEWLTLTDHFDNVVLEDLIEWAELPKGSLLNLPSLTVICGVEITSVPRALLDARINKEYTLIEEPEKGLHLTNQTGVVSGLVSRVHNGESLCVTTHSDSILRELNIRTMLHNDFSEKKEYMEKYGYKETDILNPQQVRLFTYKDEELSENERNEFGLIVNSFNETITHLNEKSNDLYYYVNDLEED